MEPTIMPCGTQTTTLITSTLHLDNSKLDRQALVIVKMIVSKFYNVAALWRV